jgi:hypothetical protein
LVAGATAYRAWSEQPLSVAFIGLRKIGDIEVDHSGSAGQRDRHPGVVEAIVDEANRLGAEADRSRSFRMKAAEGAQTWMMPSATSSRC